MPIYEFRCKKCGEILEVLTKSSNDKLNLKCKKCGSQNLEKLVSAASVVTKSESKASYSTRCGNSSPCCGSEIPCAEPPCKH